jgi:hypothetical protein
MSWWRRPRGWAARVRTISTLAQKVTTMENTGQSRGHSSLSGGNAPKVREQTLPELITGLDDIQKSIDAFGERLRIAADRLDGGHPRDATQAAPATPNGGPLAHDLNRRANDMRQGLGYLQGELMRLEAALGIN